MSKYRVYLPRIGTGHSVVVEADRFEMTINFTSFFKEDVENGPVARFPTTDVAGVVLETE